MREQRSQTEGYSEPLWFRLGNSLEWFGIVIATLGIAATPWFLGGAIPQARFVLLLAAVTASVLVYLGSFLTRRIAGTLPFCMLPMLGLAVLCVIQLLPLFQPSVRALEHAVRSDLLAQYLRGLEVAESSPRTVMPSETRLYLGQFIALTLLAWTYWQMVDSSRRLVVVLSILVANGVFQAALGLSQTFGATSVAIGNNWKVSTTAPFGCFVNPNNAAGWFLCVAMLALLLCAMLFSSSRPAADLQVVHSRGKAFLRDIHFRISQLTLGQAFSVAGCVLILIASVATLSRGGIVATAIACLTFVLSRVKRGGWLLFAAGVMGLGIVALAGLMLFDLDTLAVQELRTLKDPVSESTLRLLHWGDTLPHVLDFPMIGSGFGGYRYATLPYQRHYWGTWFQRADNQYLELLVEGGIAGLGLIALFAASTFLLCARVCLSRTDRRHSPAGSWLGSAALAMGVGIGAAAVLDYGVSLPSVSPLIVVTAAMLERRASARSGMAGGRLLSAVMISGLLAAAVNLLPDIWYAGSVYNASAAAQRFLRMAPGSIDSVLEDGVSISNTLAAALSRRPDDQEARRIRVQMIQACWREALFDSLVNSKLINSDQRTSVIPKLALPTMAEQLLVAQDGSLTRWARVWKELDEKHNWSEAASSLHGTMPWVPDLSLDLVSWELVTSKANVEQLTTRQLFMDPGAGRDLFLLGSVLQKAGKEVLANHAWEASLACTEKFRPSILEAAVLGANPEIAFRKYGPDGYRGCVDCAEQMKNSPAFRAQLLTKAEQLWKNIDWQKEPRLAAVRGRQLLLSKSTQEADEWLRTVEGYWPVNIEIRMVRAHCLETLDRREEAYEEWVIIQTLDPENKEAPVAMKRISELPPQRREVKK